MGQRVSERITVAASPERIVDVITDLEAYPSWTEGITDVEVLDRDDEGRPHDARFKVDARVVQVAYTLRYRYEPDRITWHLVDGDMINQLDGSYDLTPDGDVTEVRYSLEVDVDMPLPGFLKKRAAKVILETGLKGLKQRAEAG